MTTLEAYFTKKMVFGLVNGPCEGNIFIVLIYFFSACVGNDYWNEYSEFLSGKTRKVIFMMVIFGTFG